MKNSLSIALVTAFAWLSHGQTPGQYIRLTGRVVESDGTTPVSGVAWTYIFANGATFGCVAAGCVSPYAPTDAGGNFSISYGTVSVSGALGEGVTYRLFPDLIRIENSDPVKLRVDLHDVSGRKAGEIARLLEKGVHQLALAEILSTVSKPGLYVLRMRIGADASSHQIYFSGRASSSDRKSFFPQANAPMAKGAGPGDQLEIRKSGYVTRRVPAPNDVATLPNIVLTRAITTTTVYATRDNPMFVSSTNTALASTAYPSGALAVGCNWLYSSITYTQDYVCANSLIFFNISSLISGRTIQAASLSLDVYSSPASYTTSYVLSAAAGSWTSAVTWNSWPGTSVTGTNRIVNQPSASTATINIDVRSIVQAWANGTYANNGFFLDVSTMNYPNAIRYEATEFYSLEYNAGSTTRPRMTITYQ